MNIRKFIAAISLCVMFLVLAACQPMAATQEPEIQTVVETVVVTKEVEGETIEVVVAATPALEGASQLAVIPPASRMVIKDAELEILVDDTDRIINQVTQMTLDYGGYIISSQTWVADDYKHASLRLGIPSTSFENALNTLRMTGIDVLQETASGQDVSAEYVDLETRLANLEATAVRVRSFLDEAETVEESLKVSEELSELEGQIEQIKGQMRFYEGRTAFSTVTVFITPERPTPTPTPKPGWNPAASATGATKVLGTIATSIADIVIWGIIIAGPIIAIGAIILQVARLIAKARRSRSN